jgi:hypothetical protein
MKRIRFFLLFAFLFAGFVSAQDNYIGLAMGGSIPMGEYAATTEANKTGYAESGFSLNFMGNYYFMKFLGVGGTATFGMNGTAEEKLQEDWISYLEMLHDVTVPENANVRFITSQWTYVNLFAGPVITFPFGRLSLELKAQGGMSVITPPKRYLLITYTNVEITSNSSGSNVAFGYLLGAGLQFKPSETYGFRLGADYFASQARLNLEQRIDDGTTEGEIISEVWEMPVRTYHITLGISYYF